MEEVGKAHGGGAGGVMHEEVQAQGPGGAGGGTAGDAGARTVTRKRGFIRKGCGHNERAQGKYGADPTKDGVMGAGGSRFPAVRKPAQIPENHESKGGPRPPAQIV